MTYRKVILHISIISTYFTEKHSKLIQLPAELQNPDREMLYPQLVSDTGHSRGMTCDEAPVFECL